tara:strand:- start:853 stop:2178 length:1326 start_codon:yes stop_codon:yes gene_type:complete
MFSPNSSRNLFQEHLRRIDEKRNRPEKRVAPPAKVSVAVTTTDYDDDEDETIQTYPHQQIVRQGFDLTCGMRCLQNLYDEHIVTRQEMDEKSKYLESISSGIAMYDPSLGYYSIEVLQAVLTDKGKQVQRVDIDKFLPQYFEPAIAMNQQFGGYVVALGLGDMKHYVAITHSQGMYTVIDSLPGTSPYSIPDGSLFQRRTDNNIYCSQHLHDKTPVVAVVAVGNSPFIEYNIMHNIWSPTPPPPRRLLSSIARILMTTLKSTIRKVERAEPCVQAWFQKLKNHRVVPSEECIPFLKQWIYGNPLASINVKWNDMQTIVDCSSMQGLVIELINMGWVSDKNYFHFQQGGQMLRDQNGNDIDSTSVGTFADFSLDPAIPIDLIHEGVVPAQASVGGFYTFKYSVAGECIDNKYNAYSVRDKQGHVHVIYKQNVDNIETFERGV